MVSFQNQALQQQRQDLLDLTQKVVSSIERSLDGYINPLIKEIDEILENASLDTKKFMDIMKKVGVEESFLKYVSIALVQNLVNIREDFGAPQSPCLEDSTIKEETPAPLEDVPAENIPSTPEVQSNKDELASVVSSAKVFTPRADTKEEEAVASPIIPSEDPGFNQEVQVENTSFQKESPQVPLSSPFYPQNIHQVSPSNYMLPMQYTQMPMMQSAVHPHIGGMFYHGVCPPYPNYVPFVPRNQNVQSPYQRSLSPVKPKPQHPQSVRKKKEVVIETPEPLSKTPPIESVSFTPSSPPRVVYKVEDFSPKSHSNPTPIENVLHTPPPPRPILLNKKLKCKLVCIVSPYHFYLRLCSADEKVHNLERLIKLHMNIEANRQPFQCRNLPQRAIAKNPVDGTYYRVYVLQHTAICSKVYYMEWGDRGTVKSDHIFEVPSLFETLSFDHEAIPCTLRGLPEESTFTKSPCAQKAKKMFSKYLDRSFLCSFAELVECKKYSVDLLYRNNEKVVSVADVLIASSKEVASQKSGEAEPQQSQQADIVFQTDSAGGGKVLDWLQQMPDFVDDSAMISPSTSSARKAPKTSPPLPSPNPSVPLASPSSKFTKCDIPAWSVDLSNHRLSVSLASADTLDLFYLHIVDEKIIELDKIFDVVKTFAPSAPTAVSFNCEQLCVATVENNWYRMEVLSHVTGSEVNLLSLDYGFIATVHIKNIRMISAELVHRWPRMALPAVLQSIKPNEEDGGEFSKVALEAFQDLVGSDSITAYVCNAKAGNTSFSADYLSVILYEGSGKDLVVVNDALVEAGLAMYDDRTALVNTSDDILNWKPEEEDFFSPFNDYSHAIEDAAVAMYGFERDTEECRQFKRDGRCWRGDRCPYKHGDGFVKKVETIGNINCLPLPRKGTWVSAVVISALHPSKFYIAFPFGTKPHEETFLKRDNVADSDSDLMEVFEREREFQNYYNHSQFSDKLRLFPSLGEYIAVRHDNFWYRAIVIDLDPTSDADFKVYLIDTGIKHNVKENNSRQLVPAFSYPRQCVLAKLANIEPIKGKEFGWSSKSSTEFISIVKGKQLFAFINEILCEDSLLVDLYVTSKDSSMNVGDHLIKSNLAVRSTYNDEIVVRDSILVPG